MKKGILGLLLSASVAFMACDSATDKIKSADSNESTETVEESGTPVFAFEEEVWDFGTINAGDPAEHIFKFKNTGDDVLVVFKAVGSCGCTVPTFSKEPIEPGAEGEIKVIYDSKGKSGPASKTITIDANTIPTKKILTIKVNVNPEPKS